MLTRLCATVFAVSAALSLVACGVSPDGQPATTGTTAVAPSSAPAASTSTTATSATAPTSTSSSTLASTTAAPTTPAATATAPRPTASRTPTSAVMSSIGARLADKIVFYAAAKEIGGMTDSAKMDELADELCKRVQSGQESTVGPWLRSTYNLQGDPAAKVALAAMRFRCPSEAKRLGG